MPTYAYACTECDHRFEVVQSFSDDSLTVCPECQGRLRKLFNAVGIVFKGGGFYRTDSRCGRLGAGRVLGLVVGLRRGRVVERLVVLLLVRLGLVVRVGVQRLLRLGLVVQRVDELVGLLGVVHRLHPRRRVVHKLELTVRSSARGA